MTTRDEWIDVTAELPPDGVTVDTKIDDAQGMRNEGRLKRRGRLWFFPDDSMYVYYEPTHWRRAALAYPAGGTTPRG